ncbi:restriction endonuclease subunit S [Halalkalibacter hemicellulosilyticus]|uniref:Type I restriction-modification system n=1 Tax=Halalkalibacter hemicellulosilyticusJCM 9152 TaxID=1236971 RepID=W4QMD3_9BACI|nr:restriction endonuclease subunit S [Halalkalibacter hemicellulosilyticus]GAE32808.1 type I restriction-modification system [Halalkalibacter hemicellulosilyticusJCM 9152]
MNNQTQKSGSLIFPKDWGIVELGDIISELNSGVSVNSDDSKDNQTNLGILKTSAVSKGYFYPNEFKKIKNIEVKRAKLNPKKGSIIISRANTPELVGEVGYVEKDYSNLFLSDKLWQSRFKRNVNGRWLSSLLSSKMIKHEISTLATGTSSSMKNISKESFLSIRIPFPKIEEQNKISSILSTWDKAIKLKEKLIEQKKDQKKGLMQKLLTGEVRLPGYTEKWEKVDFGEVLKFLKKEPLSDPDKYNLLTVKLHLKGIEATDKKPNTTTKGRPYYMRKPNELLIGRQNFHNGGIGLVPENMKGYIASNAISSLKAKKGNLKFYYYYLSNTNFYQKVEYLIGGTGQKEISESMLKKLKLFIPLNVNEQNEIAKIISTSDDEITLLENELLQFKNQKQGLMQLLITGKVRVKV